MPVGQLASERPTVVNSAIHGAMPAMQPKM